MTRKLVATIIFISTVLSCSIDSASDEFQVISESVSIDEVELPDEFVLGQPYEIGLSYLVPSTCHSFNRVLTIEEGNEIIVTVLNNKLINQTCEPYEGRIEQTSFYFTASNRRNYMFRFWKGKTLEGEDNYYTVVVPVRD